MSAHPRKKARSFLALFRLVPWLRPARSGDESVDAFFYTASPGQNPLEIWSVSIAFKLTWMLLLCGALWHVVAIPMVLWPLIAILSGFVVFVIIILIITVSEPFVRWLSRTFRGLSSTTVHSTIQQLVLFAAAIAVSFDSHWIKWVGRVWITLVAIELVARLVELTFERREAKSSAN